MVGIGNGIDEWILCGMWSSDWRCNVEHHRFRKEIQLGRNSNRSKPRSFQEAFVTQSQIVDTSHLPQPGTISYTSDTLSGYFPVGTNHNVLILPGNFPT